MEPNAAKDAGPLGRLKAGMAADKRKTALLAGLLGLAAILGLRSLSSGRAPARAAGAVAPSARAHAAAQADPRGVPGTAALSGKAGDTRLDDYLETIDTTVARDLFRVDHAAFAEVEAAKSAQAQAAQQDQTESAVEAARLAREKLKEAVQRQAKALKLQSTMGGARSTAIINGSVVAVGEVIDGLVIRRIESGACVVGKDDIEVTLLVNKE